MENLSMIPCKDCITLAMCRAHIIEFHGVESKNEVKNNAKTIYYSLSILRIKCAIFKKYLPASPNDYDVASIEWRKRTDISQTFWRTNKEGAF